MSRTKALRRSGLVLAAVLTLAAALLALTGAAASPAGATVKASAPGYDTNEFGPNPEKDVNRDVPSSPSASNAPRVVPGHDTRVTGSNPGFSGFAGLTLEDQRNADNGNQFSLEPPDQGLCVGGSEVIEAVNDVFATYSTSGGQTGPVTALTPFFTGQSQVVRPAGPYGPFLSDPKCYFDPQLQRFFLTVLQIDTDPATGAFAARSHEDIAVSKSATPSMARDDWYFYSIDTTDDGTPAQDPSNRPLPSNDECPCFGDQPLIGADAYGFYITTNEFSILGTAFNGAQVYAFDKQGLANGSLKYQQVNSAAIPLAEGPAYSLQPATSPTAGSWDTDNNGTEYLVSALDFNATTDNRIAAWALTNTKSLQTVPAVTLTPPAVLQSETYGQPPNADQKKGPTPLADAVGAPEEQLATNDDRMNQVVYAAGKLWSGLNTIIRTSNGASTQTDRAGIAYFIVQPSTPTPVTVAGAIVKQGYVSLGNNDNVMYPSIGVNAAGQGVMTFSLSGQHYYPSAAYTTIDAVNGAGEVHIAAAGTRPDDGFTGYAAYGGDGAGRWGDYSAAVASPDGSVWFATEYIPGTFGFPPYLANWGTFVGHVTP